MHFYAVDEKKKQKDNSYQPTVSVSTKKTNEKVEIKVSDNGSGILKKYWIKYFNHSIPLNQQDRELVWVYLKL
jgi:signal transduction histidine kinase